MEQNSDLLDLSRDSSVMVVSKSGNSKGTGFFVDDEYLLTCFHVIASLSVQGSTVNWSIYPDIQVRLPSGDVIDATVVTVPDQSDPTPLTQDFALLSLAKKPKTDYGTVQLVPETGRLRVGDPVVFSGYPLATQPPER